MAKKIDGLKFTRILVFVVAIIVLFLGILQVAQGFIDTRDYKEVIVAAIKSKTGKEALIKGDVHVSLLPIPTIYVPGVTIKNTDPFSLDPVITIEQISIHSSFFSLFSDQPAISGISLLRPSLELQRSKNKVMQWDWMNVALLGSMVVQNNTDNDLEIEIIDGKMLYRNNAEETDFSASAIYLTGTLGRTPFLTGSFTSFGKNIQLKAMKTSGVGADATIPVDIQFFIDENNKFSVSGNLDISSNTVRLEGKLNLIIEDVLAWLDNAQEEKSVFDKIITNESIRKLEENKKLPLQITADLYQDDNFSTLKNVVFTGAQSKASGAINIRMEEQPDISMSMDFDSFDYNKWNEVFEKFNKQSKNNNRTDRYSYEAKQLENPIPSNISFKLNLSSKQLSFGSKKWENVQIAATLKDSIITINKLALDLPGQSNLALFGVVSQASMSGLRFEGSMEAQGKNLRELLSAFDESAADLPDIGLSSFFVHSNLFISSEQVRLSEADLKIGELHLNGGLVSYNDASPRIEADVKLKNINFDYFRDSWRKTHVSKPGETKDDFFMKIDKNTNLGWLKKLRSSIDFKVYIDQFTFLERSGESADFRLYAKDGELGIYNVHFNYPDETLEVSFNVNVNGEQPSVNVVYSANELDTGYFLPLNAANDNAMPITDSFLSEAQKSSNKGGLVKKFWSEKLIDMGWLEDISGVFDISVGSLKHQGLKLDQFKMRAKLSKNVMTFQALSFSYWQGKLEMLGSIYGGNVPGAAISFQYYNGELYDILNTVAARNNISGKISMSGTVTTSGVNLISWLNQAESKLLFNARGVIVRGFNVQGVLDAVAISRTAPDVFNNVNRVLIDGATQMDAQGNINMKAGVMKTPGITLKIADIAAVLSGEIKILPWKLDLSTFFQFPGLTSETVPTMSMQLVGSIDSPELHTDTSSLEAYVAKRIVSKQ